MKLSLKGYIRYLRRQHVHVQRIHAAVFAGIICALVASAILYSQYGFWHEEFDRSALVTDENRYIGKVSPLERLSQLIGEGKTRLHSISTSEDTFERKPESGTNPVSGTTTQ